MAEEQREHLATREDLRAEVQTLRDEIRERHYATKADLVLVRTLVAVALALLIALIGRGG